MTEHTGVLPFQAARQPLRQDGDLEELFEIRVLARANRLKLVRESVFPAARLCGFDDETSRDIQLAVDEACQNVIVHAYGGDGDKHMAISLYRSAPEGAAGIIIRIRDWAPPIDPADVRPRRLDQVRPGGLGTHFIQDIMDSAEFVPLDAPVGNLLQLTKTLDQNHEQ